MSDARQIADKRPGLKFSGDPGVDWLSVSNLLAEVASEPLRQVAEDAKDMRLLHKGTALRSKLGELWRNNGSYAGDDGPS